MKVIDMDTARAVAYRYLGYSARSQSQLAKRLARDEFPPEIIEAILMELTAEGYLDDEAFAAAWVTDRADRKKYGKTRLAAGIAAAGRGKGDGTGSPRRKLTMRPRRARALAAVRPQMEAPNALRNPRLCRQNKSKQRKIASFLQRRGFGWATIKQVLAELMANG